MQTHKHTHTVRGWPWIVHRKYRLVFTVVCQSLHPPEWKKENVLQFFFFIISFKNMRKHTIQKEILNEHRIDVKVLPWSTWSWSLDVICRRQSISSAIEKTDLSRWMGVEYNNRGSKVLREYVKIGGRYKGKGWA